MPNLTEDRVEQDHAADTGPRDVQTGPATPDGPQTRRLPVFDFGDRTWRRTSLEGKALISAGYTYFGQLIGHDLGNSLPLAHVPFAQKPTDMQDFADPNWHRHRYNLIENPLTLETIYGTGPAMLPHLFDPKTFLFRTGAGQIISTAFRGPDTAAHKIQSVRALYDSRNRDTTILHRLAVIWMKFHNKIALEIRPDLATGPMLAPKDKFAVYGQARSHVLSVWHRLIREEFLPRFVDPGVLALPEDELSSYLAFDESTLLHGLFRAFHALPRSEYKFKDRHRSLSEILLGDLGDDERTSSSWELDWSLFFDDVARGVTASGTKTGICASYSPSLKFRGVPLVQLDLATAQSVGPLGLRNPAIQTTLSTMHQLHPIWADQVRPDTLANRLSAAIGQPVAPETIEASPLFFVLMLEAQFFGTGGRFGPLGSILLRRTIEQAISRTRFLPPDPGLPITTHPRSMLELISNTPI